jgi:hypothetical protein
MDDNLFAKRDPAVDEFFDDLNERIGAHPCPICGHDRWVSVPHPGYVPVMAEFSLAGLVTMKLACLVCVHCYFLRSHVMDPAWHEAISALNTPDPSPA